MNDEEKILKTLKDFRELPTGRLAAITGMNYWKAVNILQEMWEGEKLECNVHSSHTTWKLKGD